MTPDTRKFTHLFFEFFGFLLGIYLVWVAFNVVPSGVHHWIILLSGIIGIGVDSVLFLTWVFRKDKKRKC